MTDEILEVTGATKINAASGLRECSQKNCEAIATQTYIWPGLGRMFACFRHALKVLCLAEAMGLDPVSLEMKSYGLRRPRQPELEQCDYCGKMHAPYCCGAVFEGKPI